MKTEKMKMGKMKSFMGVLLLSSISVAAAEKFSDDFSDPNLKGRTSKRGKWKFENGIASQAHKEGATKAPQIGWSKLDLTSGTINFKMKSKGCREIILKFEHKGHVFNFNFTDSSKRMIVYGERESPDAKPKKTKVTIKALSDVDLHDNGWVNITIAMKGEKCNLKIGERATEVNHETFAKEKTSFSITFRGGELAIKDFSFTPVN